MQNLAMIFDNTVVAFRFVLRYGFHGFGIFTHLTWQERIILYKMAKAFDAPAIFVEIGSYLGASAYFLAAAASEHEANAVVYCIDTWQNDGMSEGKRDTWEEFKLNTQQFSGIVSPIRGRSQIIGQTFSGELDLLFIDGDHSYEGCVRDVEIWLPKVKKGGVIFFHDYAWAEGVQMVVTKLVSETAVVNGRSHQNIFWCYKA